MGIYDREYYRREGSFLGSLASRGQVCKWLIGINAIIFIVQVLAQPARQAFDGWAQPGPRIDAFSDLFVLDTAAVLHGQVWRLLTYAFLHDPVNLWHVVFNMLFLWWFGSDVEDIYGHKEFLAFYLLAAFLGGVAFVATALFSGNPGLCLGASGAVTAVMVLCALHFPTRIILIFFVLPVPIWLFVLFQVAQDLFIFVNPQIKSTTAVTVHLAGAAFGFIYFKQEWRVLYLFPTLANWHRARARPRLRVYHEEPERAPEPSAVAAPAAPRDVDEHLEAKLDAVLEKVARYGQASLNDTERQILFRASEVYKRRRK